MKRLSCLLFLTACLLFNLTAIAKSNKKDFTLHCSYITAYTDFYFTLNPITFKKNGEAYMDKKLIGKYTLVDKMLYLPMEQDAMLGMDFDKGSSVYSFMMDDKKVYNYGSCEIK